MRDKDLDKKIRESLDRLYFEPDSGHWEKLDQALDAGIAFDEEAFDAVLKDKLGSIELGTSPDWENFASTMDEIESAETSEFDSILKDSLSNLNPAYNKDHWTILADRLRREAAMVQKIAAYKALETLVFILLLFAAVPFLPFEESNEILVDLVTAPDEISEDQNEHNDVLNAKSSAEREAISKKSDQKEKRSELLEENLSTPTTLNLPVPSPGSIELQKTTDEVIPAGKENSIVNSLKSLPSKEVWAFPYVREVGPLATLDHQPSLNRALPECDDCLKKRPYRRFSVSMFGSFDANYIMTPTVRYLKLEVPPAEQFFFGYGGGIGANWQTNRWEWILNFSYSSLYYEPDQYIVSYKGNYDEGIYSKGFRSAQLELLRLSLSSAYTLRQTGKWRWYVLGGLGMNTVAFAQYEINGEEIVAPVRTPDPAEINGFGAPTPPPSRKYPDSSSPKEDRLKYRGGFEGGELSDNFFLSANIGMGIERFLSKRTSIFVQPVYMHQLMSIEKGFGPNKDRYNTVSTYIGIRANFNK